MNPKYFFGYTQCLSRITSIPLTLSPRLSPSLFPSLSSSLHIHLLNSISLFPDMLVLFKFPSLAFLFKKIFIVVQLQLPPFFLHYSPLPTHPPTFNPPSPTVVFVPGSFIPVPWLSHLPPLPFPCLPTLETWSTKHTPVTEICATFKAFSRATGSNFQTRPKVNQIHLPQTI